MATPVFAYLLNYRIDPLFSFKATGLDYGVPLYVRTSEKDAILKVSILFLTCASSRAIHLELTAHTQVPSFIRGF